MYNINVKDRKGAILRFLVNCLCSDATRRWSFIWHFSYVMFVNRVILFSFSFSRKILSQYSNNNSNSEPTTKMYVICIAKCVSRRNVIFVKFGWIHARIEFNQVVTITTAATATESKIHTSDRIVRLGNWRVCATQDSEFVDNFVVRLIWNNEVDAAKKSFNRKL